MRILTEAELQEVSGGLEEITVYGTRYTIDIQGDKHYLLGMGDTDGSWMNEQNAIYAAPEYGEDPSQTIDPEIIETLEELSQITDLSADQQKQLDLIIDSIKAHIAASADIQSQLGNAETARLIKSLGVIGDIAEGVSVGAALMDGGVTIDDVASAIGFVAGVAAAMGVAAVGGSALLGLAASTLTAASVDYVVRETIQSVADTWNNTYLPALDEDPNFWLRFFGIPTVPLLPNTFQP